jgi:hypothetical protein
MAKRSTPKGPRGRQAEEDRHRRLWSVVVFHGKGRGLVGLYATKAEADAVAQKGHQRFVLPPAAAWAGKDPD